jgi:hypothetical protein
MGGYQRVAEQKAEVRCAAPGCQNQLHNAAFRILSGAGEIHDFCNKTCLREFMKGLLT